MELFLFTCILIVLLVRWVQMRNRLATIEARLDALSDAMYRASAASYAPPPYTPPPEPEPLVPPAILLPAPLPEPEPPPPPAPRSRTSEEWEALLGGSLLNKVGVFVVVIGLALLLNYAYTHIGPAGRVALSYTGAFAMLAAGIAVERREQYRTFAYGLIGGGWAALYLTTYAMHAIQAAKVLDNALAAGILLLLVAIGMIAHSLRYRSQTVTGLAYFIAFVTLAIGEVTLFSVAALVPLAASLLYVAHRNRWNRFAVFGLIATYATVAVHKDTGAPLWQAQALFLVYWLLFEAFDLVHANSWLLPLNGLGFLLLSGVKWSQTGPDDMWIFAAGSAALYLGSAIARARSGRWRAAVTFNAVLACGAILLKLEHQWTAVGLLALGEAYYLAGVRFRSRYLRIIAGAMFLLELLYLSLELVPRSAARVWEPVAIATAVAFYLNRALFPADQFYGYFAAALAALVGGSESSPVWRGPVWTLMSAAPFTLGWWRRQRDFRLQGYGGLLLGFLATAIYFPLSPLSLAIGAAATYALAQCALRSGEDRFGEREREIVRAAASALTAAGLVALVWRLTPGDWLGVAWLALALAVFEAGARNQPADFRGLAYLVALFGLCRALAFDYPGRITLIDSVLLYALALRARRENDGLVLDVATFPAALLLMAGLAAALPPLAVSGCWALLALAFLESGRRSLRAQAILAAAAVFLRGTLHDMFLPYPAASIVPAVVCFEAAMLRRPEGSRLRLYFSLLATALAAALIFHEVSGSILTIAWGLEGVALLAAGFPLRDRVLRLSGLSLLAVCTGKLFFWDLRSLDTLPRILGFLVLGLLLVAVSWIYTRFRDQVKKLL